MPSVRPESSISSWYVHTYISSAGVSGAMPYCLAKLFWKQKQGFT